MENAIGNDEQNERCHTSQGIRGAGDESDSHA
jgi:hypothetical protein